MYPVARPAQERVCFGFGAGVAALVTLETFFKTVKKLFAFGALLFREGVLVVEEFVDLFGGKAYGIKTCVRLFLHPLEF